MVKTVSHDSETPAQNRQVITACAFIHNNFFGVEKVFLPKRAITKKFLPGVFELPGGHINFGEDVEEGLKREIREELQMEVSLGEPFGVFTYSNVVKGSHSIEVVYFAKFIGDINAVKIQPEDHSEYKWVSLKELVEEKNILGSGKNNEDKEYQLIKRGLELLNGAKVNFG